MAKNTCSIFCLVSLHIFLSFVITQSAPESALITQIPGFNGTLPSKHYAGYVTVDENHGRNLYYYFVESEGKPSEDPVVLWLNGGPGCSSFDGFIYEHGPFNFEVAKTEGSLPTLHLNPYSWSKVSNIIYLDSPAGVGFSYSKNHTDYITGDLKTATDSHAFLLKWFELYPEYLPNPFFIAGESYAGVYVPTLAYEVMKGIDAGAKLKLNFKGYMVGNGVADDEFDGNALVPFAHGMGLISDDLFQTNFIFLSTQLTCREDFVVYIIRNKEVSLECNGNFYNPTSENCTSKLTKVDEDIDGLNIYDILEPCYHGTEEIPTESYIKLPSSFRKLGETDRPLPVRKRMFGRAWPLRAPVRAGIVPTWPELTNSLTVPCTDDRVANLWLNNEVVRKALHTAEESLVSSWVLCTGNILFNHDAGSMIKYHKNLTSRGYRALIYRSQDLPCFSVNANALDLPIDYQGSAWILLGGDHDMCVPFTGSEAWTRSLGYKIIDEWRPWSSNGQVAGFTQGYDNNLIFLTIKGAGHTVPEYKPQEALDFYKRFLAGLPI